MFFKITQNFFYMIIYCFIFYRLVEVQLKGSYRLKMVHTMKRGSVKGTTESL